MKKKVVTLSLLTIIMCASLIVGATLALFTSKSDVNIAVTSGNVEVVATVDEITTYSMGEETATNGTFANGGTATLKDGTITLDRVMPGDKVVAKLTITNNSNVNYKQRFTMGVSGEGAALQKQMLIGVSDTGSEYTYYNSFVTDWEAGSAATSEVKYISIELPEYVGNAAQDMSCLFTLSVEAVQGNAGTTGEAAVSRAYLVTSQDELTSTLATMQSGETVVLSGGEENWVDTDIAFEDEKSIIVCGYNVGTLTINAPNGTIEYYIAHTDTIDSAVTAGDSLHIFGQVGDITVNSGRVVMEAGAEVGTVSAEPSYGEVTTVTIASEAAVGEVTVNPAYGATAEIIVQKDAVLPSLNVNGNGDTKLENDGTVENKSGSSVDELIEGILSEESLLAKLQEGGEVKLAADITVSSATPTVPEGVTVSIDLNGYTLTSELNSGIVNYGTITSLTNGNIMGGKAYGIVNDGHIGTLNVNIQTGSDGYGPIYVRDGVIDLISGGSYKGYPDVFDGSITGSNGLYISSKGVVKEISGGYFQGSQVAFRSYNKNGIELISGGFFDSPYMDANGRTFCDSTTIGNLFYNNAPLKITGGTFYNAGSKLNSSLESGYTLVQGDVCKMTSYKEYTADRVWVDNDEGAVYYYYTVVNGTGTYVPATDDAVANGTALVNAVNAADANTTLMLGAGTYELSQTLTITKNLTILGNGSVVTGDVNLFIVNSGAAVTFKGLTFEATARGVQAITANGDVVVENCETSDSQIAHMVYINGSAGSVVICDCTSSRPFADIEAKSDVCTLLIEGCSFNGGYDVYAVTCTSKLINVTFRNVSFSKPLVRVYNNQLTTVSNVVFEGNEGGNLFNSINETVQGVISAAIASDELVGAVQNGTNFVQA